MSDNDSEIFQRLGNAETTIAAHLAACDQRYESLDIQMRGANARLKRIEQIFIASAGAIILLLLHLAFK